MPRFRRRGVGEYRFSAEVQYLRARGCHVCYKHDRRLEHPSQRCVERYGATFDVSFSTGVCWDGQLPDGADGAPPPSPR
jgi:hypothetical protein